MATEQAFKELRQTKNPFTRVKTESRYISNRHRDFDRRWEQMFGSDEEPSIMSVEDTLEELKAMRSFA